MDFIEAPFGGEDVEVPLLTSTVIRPSDDIWTWQPYQGPLDHYFVRLDASSSAASKATFIQEWLYFGLLAVLCDTAIKGYDLSTPGKRRHRVVNSELVKSKLINMQVSVLQLPEKERAEVLQRHSKILSGANEAAHWAESHFAVRSNSSESIDLILLSVKILISTISRSYHWTHDRRQRLEKASDWSSVAIRQGDKFTPAGRAIEVKMRENGWCVHQIHKVLSTFSYHTAYYFARLPRPGSARAVHESCSKNSCKGWNSQPGQTSARHATDACTCPTISISSVDVAKVIQDGHIPLVSIEEDVHGSLALRLHTKQWHSRYVAISHVWADGLGNAFENGLPTCQLRMLQTYFAQIAIRRLDLSTCTMSTTNTLFWMDTLCIPVQTAPPAESIPEEILQDVKGKAIDRMNLVYASSKHTLVLDAELRMIPMAANHTTRLAYIQCCGWTTRSWTLQEGCLPPSTVFAFSDGIYSHNTARLDVPQSPPPVRGIDGLRVSLVDPEFPARHFDSLVQREIWALSSVQYLGIWGPFKPRKTGCPEVLLRDRFARIWNELLDRVSSLPADTPVILANLLGVSAYEVLNRKTEQERIALIIRQQKVLPVELLFNTGPRLRGRLCTHVPKSRARSQMQHHVPAQETTPEESIGLLEISEPQTQSFRNGWVPASIEGDKCLQPFQEKFYLQVLEDRLQFHSKGGELAPYIFWTAEGPSVPIPTFVVDLRCAKVGRVCHGFITIDVLVDSTPLRAQDRPQERVLGHCFMLDHGPMLAWLSGRVDSAPGCHLMILSRSDGRITTRYSSPIRINRCANRTQTLRRFPTLGCKCNCPGCHPKRDYVEILYDADDLGPLLTTRSEPPSQLIQRYWFTPWATFVVHYTILEGLTSYIVTGPARTRVLYPSLSATLIIPGLVYLYQNTILQQAAKRLLLKPLSDGRQPSRPFRFLTRNPQHLLDGALVAHWSIVLFGSALDWLFWVTLLSLGRSSVDFNFEFDLSLRLTIITLWYVKFATRNPSDRAERMRRWIYVFVMMLCFAKTTYDWYNGLQLLLAILRYCSIFSQILLGFLVDRCIPWASSTAYKRTTLVKSISQ